MKIRWNRLNRGIILAAVLAMGTAAYVIGDNIAFKQKEPELKARAEEIGRALAESNVGTNREGIVRNQIALVQNDFLEGQSSVMDMMSGMSMTKSDMLYQLNNEDMFSGGYYNDSDEEVSVDSEVYAVKYDVISSSVSKGGPTSAYVTMDYKVSYDITGEPTLFGFDGYDYTTMYFDSNEDKSLRKVMTFTGSVTLTMRPDGDTWKVLSAVIEESGYPDIDYDGSIAGGESDE